MLNAHEIVRLWEITSDKPYWQRGVLMLAAACPDQPLEALAHMSLGQRNARLFRFRDQLFGQQLEASSACPECTEAIEFILDSQIICNPEALPWDGTDITLQEQGTLVTFTPPNSVDLQHIEPILAAEDTEAAEEALVWRCVSHYKKDGTLQPVESLPALWLDKLAEKIRDVDTHSDIRCRLNCPECEHSWSENFDIVNFLWHEITVKAHIILSEVQMLAKAFGWWEGDILSLSDVRRRYYLEGLNA